jgi:hypothetical protein
MVQESTGMGTRTARGAAGSVRPEREETRLEVEKDVHFVHLIQRATFAWAYFAAAEQANVIAFLFLAFRQAFSLYPLVVPSA